MPVWASRCLRLHLHLPSHPAAHPSLLSPLHTRSLEQQALPVEEAALAQAHASARAAALAKFEREKFGSSLEALRAALEAAIEREYRCVGGSCGGWVGAGCRAWGSWSIQPGRVPSGRLNM